MISVCLPVFNFNVESLVNDITNQLATTNISYEILIYDDGSKDIFKENNKKLTKIDHVIYKELPENIGRARIRNLLAHDSKHPYLLFLDCDSIITDNLFIDRYLKAIEQSNPKVICGGRLYESKKAKRSNFLRWKYGVTSESKPAKERSMVPSKSFMTNNFIVKRDIFESIKFDESLYKYGHEDTLFGYELWKNKIIPLHIENPVLNGDIEKNWIFLRKTRQGIENLAYIYYNVDSPIDFSQQITLINYYENFKPKSILTLMHPILFLIMHLLLLVKIAPIKLFNSYKLSYFALNLSILKGSQKIKLSASIA